MRAPSKKPQTGRLPRDVWQVLSQSREIGQTSVLKTMQIMRDKGLLICDTDQRPQVCSSSNSQILLGDDG